MRRSSEQFVRRVHLAAPAAETFAWHERPGALERMSPPWDRVRVVSKQGTIHDGDRVVIALGSAFGMQFEAVHHDFVAGRRFHDDMVRGPFARWSHRHEVIPDGDGASILEDAIDYALPLGWLGRAVGGRAVRARLERMFAYRHVTLRRDLERHMAAPSKRLRIAVTGASGVLGQPMVAFLRTGGHHVLTVVRRDAGTDEVRWDPARGEIDAERFEGLDAVVHLAGENVGTRWTDARKQRILRSRVDGTTLLARTLARLQAPPRVLVSASGIGIYGAAARETVDEGSAPGDDFLVDVCRGWEAATDPARSAGIRVVNLRLGVVLTPSGGALAELAPPFQLGVGGPIGDGTQVMSWIGLDDAIGAIHHAIQTEALAGAVNAVAPNAVTNAELAATLGRVLRRPARLRVPAAVVEAMFGEMGRLTVLGGVRVTPRALLATGFPFAEPELEPALRHALGRLRTSP